MIKDMATVHLAAEVMREDADVVFIDETIQPGESHRWAFHVLDATPEDAAAAAIDINAKRRVAR